MNGKPLISLSGGVISNPLRRLAAPASFELRQGECIAVVGPNGSGKSTLLKMITGSFYLRDGSLKFNLDGEAYRAIRTVEFDNAYSTTETQYYHQQRWQAFEREASPLAGELLSGDGGDWQQHLFHILGIEPLLGKEIITLSSGELRRFSIARALMQRPQILILESPFVGLDPPTRDMLCSLLEQLLHELGISIIMTLTDPERIPAIVTHVYLMNGGRISGKICQDEIRSGGQSAPEDITEHCGGRCGAIWPHSGHGSALDRDINDSPGRCEFRDDTVGFFHPATAFNKVVDMRDINISYGERQIFRNLNWTVHSGERWNVSGPNGSGKSTLLSLVNADNPRAYSLDITLFDRRRGTGESIWDIKRHIGYLSSEMHSSFRENLPVLEIVRSGLGDRFCDKAPASGLGSGDPISVMPGGKLAEAQSDTNYRPTINHGSDLQQNPNNQIDSLQPHNTGDNYLLQWLRLFGAEHLAQRSYLTLSSGEQRYILLIRAFVKDPDLLILDEPFQGLDPEMRHRAAAVIESFCAAKNKTLIFVTHYIDEVPGVVTNTLQL